MKGKYAKRAELTRDWTALQTRAETAEREAARLAVELSDQQARSSQAITTLRGQLTEVRRQRDAAEGPAVAALEEQNRQLRTTAAEWETRYKARDDQFWFGFKRMIIAIQAAFGASETEARELVVNALGAGGDVTITAADERTRGIKDPELVKLLQRVRGARSADDPSARSSEALGIDDFQRKVR